MSTVIKALIRHHCGIPIYTWWPFYQSQPPYLNLYALFIHKMQLNMLHKESKNTVRKIIIGKMERQNMSSNNRLYTNKEQQEKNNNKRTSQDFFKRCVFKKKKK